VGGEKKTTTLSRQEFLRFPDPAKDASCSLYWFKHGVCIRGAEGS